VQELVDVLGI